MAFAAAVMSTSAGHRAFAKSPSSDAFPSTPPRIGPQPSLSNAGLPRSLSNNSNNIISSSSTMNNLNSAYINQFNTSLSSFKPRSSPPTPQQNATAFTAATSSSAMPESPHMIRCSTCNSQVPLADLSDHICRPPQAASSSSTAAAPALLPPPRQASASATQHSRLASGFSHNAPPPPISSQHATRNMLNPLRVNISHAPQGNAAQFEAPLPTPYRTPLPRSPSSASHSPSNHSQSASPGTSPAGATLSSSLSPSYPFEQAQSQSQSQTYPHQRSPYSSAAENNEYNNQKARGQSPINIHPSYFEQQRNYHQHSNGSTPPLAQSPSSRSDIDLSAENNAGIGARMPFYERLQQERNLNSPVTSPSLSPNGGLSPVAAGAGGTGAGQCVPSQYSPPLPARLQNKPWTGPNGHGPAHSDINRMADLPKSPISPGWSGLANEEPDIFQRFMGPRRLDEDEEHVHEERSVNGITTNSHVPPRTALTQAKDNEPKATQRQQQQGTSNNNHHHVRETSDSDQSSSMSHSYSDHLDYFIKDGSTPETSPEFPDTPLFKDDHSARLAYSSSSSSAPFGLQQQLQNDMQAVEDEGEDDDDGYNGYADDIIDSYPTPQQHFSGRFGGLVIDDDAAAPGAAYHNQSQAPPAEQSPAKPPRIDTSALDRLIPSPEPVPLSSPLLRSHSDRTYNDAAPPFRAQLGRGIPSSHSTPNNLSRLAGIDTTSIKDSRASPRYKVDESAIPFTQRRRLHSEENVSGGSISPSHSNKSLNQQIPSPTTEGSGVCLDACLDDLLKEMNRESVETVPAARAQSDARSPLSPNAPSSNSTTPTSPGAPSSNLRNPFEKADIEAPQDSRNRPHEQKKAEVQCDSCNLPVRIGAPVERDGQSFCSECYAQLYLPKCRKCRLPIEDKAIGSGDGKVKGKFHIGCFSCFSCSAPFPTGDFYVYGNRPYCAQHYHERNGTLCANPGCSEEQRGIEGPCVSLVGEESGNGGRYHPTCFKCSDRACEVLLDQYHYVLNGLPYCERHANEIEDQDTVVGNSRSVSPPRNVVNDDFYDARQTAAQGAASAATEQRRRSASLDIPVQSLNQLRKNAQAPNYRGMLARRRSGAGRRPSESGSGGWNNPGRNQLPHQYAPRMAGPPPVSRTRRAEKRRTVISQIRLH